MKRSITILHIKKKNLLWDQCDNLSKVSKQLYNVGLYILRQGLVKEERWISSKELYDTMKLNENWVLLPRKVSNQVWRQVNSSWSSWLKALKAFAKSPKGFLGRPKMPKYQSDRNIVAYEKGALGVRGLKKGFLRLSQTDIIFDSMGLDVVEVKILPKGDYYTISMIYNKKEVKNEKLKKEKIASFDLGLNNLVAIATNQVAIPHKLVNGRYLKSVNQHWNKRKAKLQSLLPDKTYTSFQIRQITKKRNNRVDTFLHQASRAIVNWLLENEIGTIDRKSVV